MLVKREIIAFIDPKTGEVTIETRGFKGAGCIEATKQIEVGLGNLKAQEKTSEFFKEPDPKQAYIAKMN